MEEKTNKNMLTPKPPNYKSINLLQSPALYTSFFTPPTSPNDISKFRSLYQTPQIPQFETPLNSKRFMEHLSSNKNNDSFLQSPKNQNKDLNNLFFSKGGTITNNSSNNISPNINTNKRTYSMINDSPIILKKQTCNCRKSECLKLYCECFSSGEICGAQCSCSNCKNNKKFINLRNEAVESVLNRQPDAFNSKFETNGFLQDAKHKKGCNCKKSNCLKKYCECFSEGIPCTNNCNCNDCKNNHKIRSPAMGEELEKTIKKRKINSDHIEITQRTVVKNSKPMIYKGHIN